MGANEDSGKRNLKSGTPKKPFIYYYFLVILAVMVYYSKREMSTIG